VIATFVLGLGSQVSDTAPQASFDFDYDSSGTDDFANSVDNRSAMDGVLTITHTGGATIEAQQLSTSGSAIDGNSSETDVNVKWSDSNADVYGDTSEITAGNDLKVGMSSGDTIQVIWENAEGTNSATLGEFDGPDA
jgi:FlaG/FlaF family flagellin (archaellin)